MYRCLTEHLLQKIVVFHTVGVIRNDTLVLQIFDDFEPRAKIFMAITKSIV